MKTVPPYGAGLVEHTLQQLSPIERDVNGQPVNTTPDNELWGSDPTCVHDIRCAPFGGGVKCTKCDGWFCY